MRKCRLFLFSYYGGKSKIAHLYPSPVGDTIVEPFAGAANYSCLHFQKQVILYEINPVIFGILDFLIKSSPQDILNLPLMKPGEDVRDLKVCQEARDLIGMGVNQGASSPRNVLTKRAIESPYSAWSSAGRFRIACFVKRIKHWKVFNKTCWNAFEDRDTENITWFVDPPYQGPAGNGYEFGSSRLNFRKLGKTVQRLKGAVIVCEGENANWLPFQKLIKHGSMKSDKWEMIWTQGFTKRPGIFDA